MEHRFYSNNDITDNQVHLAMNVETSFWVNASAGSGKTRLLINRVLTLLLRGVKSKNILCLTFTKAAAREMLERLKAITSSWIKMSDEEIMQEITEFLPNSSQDIIKVAKSLFFRILEEPVTIQTIHSYAQNILNKFHGTGILQNPDILDNQHLLIEKAINRFIKEIYTTEDSEKIKILEHLSSKLNQKRFYDLITKVILNSPDPYETLLDYPAFTRSFYNLINIYDSFLDSPEGGIIECGASIIDLSGYHREIKGSNYVYTKKPYYTNRDDLKLLAATIKESDPEKSQIILNWLSHVESCEDTDPHLWDEYLDIFITKSGEGRQRVVSSALIRDNKAIDDIIQKEIRTILHITKNEHLGMILKNSYALYVVTHNVNEIYKKIKSELHLISYDDIIDEAITLLKDSQNTNLSYQLESGIDHLLIDEAQDTNPKQWELIRLLSEHFYVDISINRTLFVVGDFKQSIYGFQGVLPNYFNYMHDFFREKTLSLNKKWHTISLDHCYRSCSAILEVVDKVFVSKSGVRKQEEEIKHIPKRVEEGYVEIWPLIEEDPGRKSKKGVKEILAENIAKLIKDLSSRSLQKLAYDEQMLEAPHRRTGAYPSVREDSRSGVTTQLSSEVEFSNRSNRIRPSDFMILLQRRGDMASFLQKAISAEGIPVAGLDRYNLLDFPVVIDILNLAECAYLPHNNLKMAEVLRGPFGGVSEEDLFYYSYTKRKELGEESLWEVIKNHPMNKDESFVKFMQELIETVNIESPFQFFKKILDKDNNYFKLVNRFGPLTSKILDNFIEIAFDFNSKKMIDQTVGEFFIIDFIDFLKTKNPIFKTDQENEGVRIMTIHGSKGLESKVVILGDANQPFINENELIWLKRGTQVVPIWFSDTSAVFKDVYTKRLSKSISEESERLLYVALTRARDALFITGWSRRTNSNSWYKEIIKSLGINEWHKWSRGDIRCAYESGGSGLLAGESVVDDGEKNERIQLNTFAGASRIVPTSSGGGEGSSFIVNPQIYGVLVHKLLEVLPTIAVDDRAKIGRILIHHTLCENQVLLNDENLGELSELVLNEAMGVLSNPTLEWIFKDSYSELEVMTSEGLFRIDRVITSEDKKELSVVDFKTGERYPEMHDDIPREYVEQLNRYEEALKEIYEGYSVSKYLLYTKEQALIDYNRPLRKLYF